MVDRTADVDTTMVTVEITMPMPEEEIICATVDIAETIKMTTVKEITMSMVMTAAVSEITTVALVMTTAKVITMADTDTTVDVEITEIISMITVAVQALIFNSQHQIQIDFYHANHVDVQTIKTMY